MATFTPPIEPKMVPPYLPESPGLAKRVMGHYASGSQGRNVYILNDDTVTEVDPNGVTVKWTDVAHAFYGGHVAEGITAHEQTLLQNAGYGGGGNMGVIA